MRKLISAILILMSDHRDDGHDIDDDDDVDLIVFLLIDSLIG